MVDPVRTGPVTPIAASASGTADVLLRKPQPVQVATSREAAPTAKASLPRLLDLVAELSHSGPPVNHARIAQVRRAIADGSYKIDVDALAKAIVSFAPED